MLRTQLTSSGCRDSWCLTSCFVNLGDVDCPGCQFLTATSGYQPQGPLPLVFFCCATAPVCFDSGFSWSKSWSKSCTVLKTSSLKCHCGVFSGAMAVLKHKTCDVEIGCPRNSSGPRPRHWTIPNPFGIIVGQEVMKCKTQEQEKHNETQAELVRKPGRGGLASSCRAKSCYASNKGT